MSSTRLLLDQHGGIMREIHVEDPHDLTTIVASRTIQNCDPVLDHVQRLRDGQGGQGRDMRLVAEIPVSFIEGMIRDGSIHDQAAIRKMLNNPEMRAFRVKEGRV